MGIYKPGDIVKFDILLKQYAEDGFAMSGVWDCDEDELVLFQTIDIETFPSWRDFKGKSTKVKHNNYAMIIKRVGRPHRICQGPECEMYDVYEVLTSKFTKRCVFKYNIVKTL